MNYTNVTWNDILTAPNGQERFRRLWWYHYNLIYSAHSNSIIYPTPVGTSSTLCIDITTDFSDPIILPRFMDFNGWTIQITNNTNDGYVLFALPQNSLKKTTVISLSDIDTDIFHDNPSFETGLKLIKIEDENYWIDEALSYNGQPLTTRKFKRQDILLVKDGVALNKPIAPYNNAASYLKCLPESSSTNNDANCYYYDLELQNQGYFKNANFIRSGSQMTFIVSIRSQNDYILSNIAVETILPTGITLTGDAIICVEDSTNIYFDTITINGTYSAYNSYGYGIVLNNIWNCHINNLVETNAEWGVFGCNSINKIVLNGCTLNRFDIHCYGIDVTCVNCEFRNQKNTINTYNQFSGMYGTIAFYNCVFHQFRPVLIDPSYNAYTGFDIIMKNCTINGINASNNSLIEMGLLDNQSTPKRPEMVKKCWPNVSISGLTFQNITSGSVIYLFKIIGSNTYNMPLGHITWVFVSGLSGFPSSASFYACNVSVDFENKRITNGAINDPIFNEGNLNFST